MILLSEIVCMECIRPARVVAHAVCEILWIKRLLEEELTIQQNGKKYFQVEFEGLNGGTWVSVTERS